jgi:hypothetical protein
MQGRDRLHCLTRRGLAALSRNGGRSGDGRRAMDGGRWSRRLNLAALISIVCTSIAASSDATRVDSTEGSGLFEGQSFILTIKSKDRRGAKCQEAV